MLCEILKSGPVIGRFKDAEIHEWLDIHAGRYEYDGVVTTPRFDPKTLPEDCLVVNPGILYRKTLN